jgi:hypothetical protein
LLAQIAASILLRPVLIGDGIGGVYQAGNLQNRGLIIPYWPEIILQLLHRGILALSRLEVDISCHINCFLEK